MNLSIIGLAYSTVKYKDFKLFLKDQCNKIAEKPMNCGHKSNNEMAIT